MDDGEVAGLDPACEAGVADAEQARGEATRYGFAQLLRQCCADGDDIAGVRRRARGATQANEAREQLFAPIDDSHVRNST